MISFVRVDHRLLHGQVIYSWMKSVECDTIFVVSDSVAESETKKNALRMVKPADKKLVMKSVDDAIKAIQSGVTDKYHMFIILGSIEELVRLSAQVEEIRSVNLGETLAGKDTKAYFPQVNLTQKNVEDLKDMMRKGIEIECRMVPSDTRIVVNKKWEV